MFLIPIELYLRESFLNSKKMFTHSVSKARQDIFCKIYIKINILQNLFWFYLFFFSIF